MFTPPYQRGGGVNVRCDSQATLTTTPGPPLHVSLRFVRDRYGLVTKCKPQSQILRKICYGGHFERCMLTMSNRNIVCVLLYSLIPKTWFDEIILSQLLTKI